MRQWLSKETIHRLSASLFELRHFAFLRGLAMLGCLGCYSSSGLAQRDHIEPNQPSAVSPSLETVTRETQAGFRGQRWGGMAPPQLATPSQRLMMEQVEELIVTGDFQEAIFNLEKLFDQGVGQIIEGGAVQKAGTLVVQKYVPVRRWVRQRLASLMHSDEDVRQWYQARTNELAEAALQKDLQSKDVSEVTGDANRYFATNRGPDLFLLLADLLLERGWSIAAMQAVQAASPDLRAELTRQERTDTLPWSLVWRRFDNAQIHKQVEVIRNGLSTPTLSGWKREDLLVEALSRVILALGTSPNDFQTQLWLNWITRMSDALPAEKSQQLTRQIADQSRWKREAKEAVNWNTFAGNVQRNGQALGHYDLNRWPSWSQNLERYTAHSDRVPASKPRVGEVERGTLPYHPVVKDGKVFLNTMTRIIAFDLRSGKAWPDIRPSRALFDSRVSAAAYLPLGYPIVGTPRGTLSISDSELYARMGDPVTGWANREVAPDGGSFSQIVGLDLDRQGAMLKGFPLRLQPPDFDGFEFDGAPLVWGDLLLVAVVERDNVGLRRSIAAFDRRSGDLRWRSGVLAAGTVEGSDRANLISHQLLTAAGGRIYYNTNLGAIACLDPLSGRTVWLTQYERAMKSGQRSYPTPDRFRYRDLTPCLFSRELLYCAPQDCPEIFALDATTGDLVWSTDSQQVSDAIHLIGLHGDSLIVSGDRLAWLDRLSGTLLARFPGSSTPTTLTALPSPRGLGRGVLCGDKIYWPTAGEIYVFRADPTPNEQVAGPKRNAKILSRIKVGARGKEGGNIVIADESLLFLSPSRIMTFESPTKDNITLVP